MEFRWEIIINFLPLMLKGASLTLQLTAISVAIGTLIGLIVSLMRVSGFKPLLWLSKSYIDFLRGTPLLVQIFLVHYGGPQVLREFLGRPVTFAAMMSAVIALSLNSGAYIAEIFRGGIQSIERGQMEAARSLGMTYGQAMRYVILPQAFKRSIPPLGNEFIAMLKDSSLVSVIALQELMMVGRIMQGRTFRAFETYIGIAIFYLIMTMSISQIVSYMERRYGKSDQSD
ncbi:MAG: amino acid ABC transporter permease [Bacillota bacterium]|nr:amino acid ABC transporter permease [Bacillota bacterium]MDW7683572.1 amino acid ABC transporter permease [Bacillota bacterium]